MPVKRGVIAFTYAFAAGFFEELGWTAFAVHELKSRHRILGTGLRVGIAWGAWHLLVAVWGSAELDEPRAFSATAFLPQLLFYAMVLPAYRILLVWIYERTSCISAAMVMHASLTASLPLALAPSATGLNLALAYLVLAVVLWAGIAIATSTGAFRSSRNEQMLALRGLLVCGATSILPYLASLILLAAGRYNNCAESQSCIVETARGAANRAQIGPLIVTHNLLTILFGIGLGSGDLKTFPLHLVAFGAIGMGVQAAAIGLLSFIHSGETSGTYIDTLRGIFMSSESLLRLLAIGPGTVIAGPTFSLYTLLSIALCLLEACVKATDSSAHANDPYGPWKPIWESVGKLIYLQWVFVLSIMQARKLQGKLIDAQFKKSS
ncbi:hypothetical protein LTR84_011869 [Exophiala bonariae]|uniref:CAAX prenyl protease 2/Lysostaphin resistance protein A-like domain-containing protein n=1 Tax=Exophiala bonariae TaxID=1690606 RepID=A0AAV9NHE1_9EURO|nr:hypothetical protein LTR84_011869 [Exophiala bonariae]